VLTRPISAHLWCQRLYQDRFDQVDGLLARTAGVINQVRIESRLDIFQYRICLHPGVTRYFAYMHTLFGCSGSDDPKMSRVVLNTNSNPPHGCCPLHFHLLTLESHTASFANTRHQRPRDSFPNTGAFECRQCALHMAGNPCHIMPSPPVMSSVVVLLDPAAAPNPTSHPVWHAFYSTVN
jgi:hypothetical protein